MVLNGDFEDVNVATPTIVSQGLNGLGGHSASWSIELGTFSDDRVRLRLATMKPHSGRHCGAINLASGAQVNMSVPLRFPQSLEVAGGTRKLRLWARCSPPGSALQVLQGGQPVAAAAALGVDWEAIEVHVEVGADAASTATMVLAMRAPTGLGGSLWLDDVEFDREPVLSS